MNKTVRYSVSFFVCAFLSVVFYSYRAPSHELVHTIYGDYTVQEPVLCDLLHSKAFTRLKGIRQYGVDDYIHVTKYPYNRHIHSLGVFALLRKYGAQLDEQVAGLLHDVSHTVFSHVGDHVAAQMHKQQFDQNDDAYQDNMHCWYLNQTDIAPILQKYDMNVEQINHKGGDFHMLEGDLPDICADRLEYNLYGGYIEGWITEQEVNELLSHLHYDGERWWFDDAYQARKLAEISLRLCEDIFASSWNIGSYEWAAKALLRAVDLDMLSMDDIHFGQDDAVWELLTAAPDENIKESVRCILSAKTAYKEADESDYDLSYVSKFRGINPWVQTHSGYQRLTDIDHDFIKMYDRVKLAVSQKHYLKFATATS